MEEDAKAAEPAAADGAAPDAAAEAAAPDAAAQADAEPMQEDDAAAA